VLNLRLPSREHVGLLQKWLDVEAPLQDAGRSYLADSQPLGDRQFLLPLEPRELASLNGKYDSMLARILRRTPFGWMYMVCIDEYKKNV